MQRDERLAELVGHGSEAAFEAIVHRYRGPLVRHCARVVGANDADEAVQNALLKAHRALARGATVHTLGAWLHAIAHNSSLELLRQRPQGLEYREQVARQAPDAEPERLDALVSAVASLPARQRQAIVMRELEGRSYDEIAARLETSNGAVRQLLNRARTSIRDRLGALIPAELVLRWTTMAAAPGSGASRALTLAGSGAIAAKISSVILLSAAPVVASAPISPHVSRARAAQPGRVTHSLGASERTAPASSSPTVVAPARSMVSASSRQAWATGATRAVGPQPTAARSSSALDTASSRVSSPNGRFAPRMNTSCSSARCSSAPAPVTASPRQPPPDRS
jgi:RNA polymerase sigma factor (sigma-70 family)